VGVVGLAVLALVVARDTFGSAQAQEGTAQTYLILYTQEAAPADAASSIEEAGGTLLYSYDEIGVAVAQSDSASFADEVEADPAVENAVSTEGFGVKPKEDIENNDPETAEALVPNSSLHPPAGDNDPLSPLQWDMRQIRAPEAHAITQGRPWIVVGDIDTGLDWTHPDLAPNVDFDNSVDCTSGVPNQDPAAWMDNAGHGTHTAGTIAAVANGIGIVGVAPNVKIAGIKAGNDDGYFFPEAVVCAHMWAATHHIDVTNNSYFADPWYFNCPSDPEQRAILTAERRAVRFAQRQGVVVVAAMGNFSDDLAHPTQDVISPDFPPGSEVTRSVDNSCLVVPVELPGVIGVSGDGNLGIKSFYSNYGFGEVEVTAPGGDSLLQVTADAVNGRVLSTWPAALVGALPPSRIVMDGDAVYGYLQGTSMASPHVAGVAALIMSQFWWMGPAQVQARINQTAEPIACPDAATLALYEPFPSESDGAPQECQGGKQFNSWYGHGEVDALKAVTSRWRWWW
jgi:subtilisin family serine protease